MRHSRKPVVSWAGDQLTHRVMPTAVYRAELLEKSQRSDANYEDRQIELRDRGLFDPRERAELEAVIAAEARLDPRQVMIYCPSRAPGYKRVEHWVADTPDDASAPRQSPGFGVEVKRRHLGLWELWVFVAAGNPGAEATVAKAAQRKFGFANMIAAERRER